MSNIYVKGSFVHIPISPSVKTQVYITRQGKTDIYDIVKDKERNVFPLQYGEGLYSIKIFQSVKKNKYTLVLSQIVNCTNSTECYLKPSAYVWYGDAVQKLSDKINADNPENRLSAYYHYCLNKIHISWFAREVDLARVLRKKRGPRAAKPILLCALCRINNLESRLVFGKLHNKNHIWCQVKLKGEWRSLDPIIGKKYNIKDYIPERYC